MSELKPCPFCGSENIKHHHYSNQPYQQYIVRCKNCGARIIKASLELAFEAWNRRAEPVERTAKVIKHDVNLVTEEGYKCYAPGRNHLCNG